MVPTKHCCYGLCKSDSRYYWKEHMKNVKFIPFPKPKTNFEKCTTWSNACGRENFGPENVKRNTYICSLHFVGENGPTEKHPDPVPATYTPEQVARFTHKRKAPKYRTSQKKVPKLQQNSQEEDHTLAKIHDIGTMASCPASKENNYSMKV